MKKKSKFWIYPLIIMGVFLMLTNSCKKDKDKDKDNDDVKQTGVLKFKTINPWASGKKSTIYLKSTTSNPPLIGDTTVTIMTSMKVCVGDVWVSQGEVKAGQSDNLEWIRLTEVTNQDLKLFENYSFYPVELSAGTYKSIKITFKNIFYRHTELVSDPSIKYELLETMGSSFDPCDENDTSWAKTNYFSTDGNHKLNNSGVFELVAPGEKVGGFTIETGKTAIVNWRLGGGVTEPCINYLFDLNGNLEWDCGIDNLEDECPPEMENMFDFFVEYE